MKSNTLLNIKTYIKRFHYAGFRKIPYKSSTPQSLKNTTKNPSPQDIKMP